ncbi:MAG: class I SAM-dependent methyltransferase [Ilyomonas sp.]
MYKKVKKLFFVNKFSSSGIKKNANHADSYPKELLRDIYAYQQLNPLLSTSSYLPFSTASLTPSSISVLLNDVIVNKRKHILEFGSGVTTYLLARLCLLNQLNDVKIISVDENEAWIGVVEELLEKDKLLDGNIRLIHAPLIKNDLAINETSWYDETSIISVLGLEKIDCVLVDGPSAWREEVKYSRYPALPFIYQYLSENSVVFLDDAHRVGEKFIIERWKQEYTLEFQQFHRSFCGFFKGQYFSAMLF